MDEKSQVQSRGNEEELRRIRHENQCLRAEVERVRRERDDAETRFASSQAKVTELEHQVRKQSLTIADLKAEIRTRPEVCMESGPPVCGGTVSFLEADGLSCSFSKPPAAPEVPNVTSDFIEISDDEGGGPREPEKKRRSLGPSRSRPEEVDSGHNQVQPSMLNYPKIWLPTFCSLPSVNAISWTT
jgi:hypothetical protein